MLDKNKSLTHDCGCGCADCAGGCTDCACGKRNRFFRGKRMKADDFEIEQLYSIERRRIINRSVIGTGVVNGFSMGMGSGEVGPGFALDEHGREIVLAHAVELGQTNVFLVAHGASGCRVLPIDQIDPDKHYVLSIHYAERRFGDANLPERCGCEKPEKNYICETGIFSLTEICDPCPCGEEPCDWECSCRISDSCGQPEQPPHTTPRPASPEPKPYAAPGEGMSKERIDATKRALEAALERLRKDGELVPPEHFEDIAHELVIPNNRGGRGPHACLCHRLMDDPVDCHHPALCEWNGYYIDPAHGVALACVRAKKTDDECRPVEIDVIDACGPRHFVKSNELLYDFIRGCDLTHISWVSWYAWHRRLQMMPWNFFAGLFHLNQNDPNDPENGKTEFVVRFSAPVLTDTIRYDSIVMRAITIEQATDWRLIRRIPIVRLDFTPYQSQGFPGTTDQVRIYVSSDWIDDEILGRSSWLTRDGFEVEIEIFGDGILDCHRQPIDGEAIGLEAFPSGNGSPGGIYRSAFRVRPKPHKSESAA